MPGTLSRVDALLDGTWCISICFVARIVLIPQYFWMRTRSSVVDVVSSEVRAASAGGTVFIGEILSYLYVSGKSVV